MKNLSFYLVGLFLVVLLSENVTAQQFDRMKIVLANGVNIEGRNGKLESDYVNVTVSGLSKNYSLEEVNVIMGKKGRAGQYALGCGGGCLAIGLVTTVINPNEDDVGTLLLGSVLWAGIFAGVGAVIGVLADPWQTIYTRGQQSSVFNQVDLSLSSNRIAPYNIGLVYRFEH